MKKISVVDILETPVLLSTDKAKTLFDILINELKCTDEIILDFTGYNFLSTTFLNNSFGDLILNKNWDLNNLKEHINIIGLSQDDMEELELSVENSRFKKNLIDQGLDPVQIYSVYTT